MFCVWVEEKIDGDFSIISESTDFKQLELRVNDCSINAFIKTVLRLTVTALETSRSVKIEMSNSRQDFFKVLVVSNRTRK